MNGGFAAEAAGGTKTWERCERPSTTTWRCTNSAWRNAAGVVSIGSAPQADRPAAATVVSSAASRRIGALLDEVPAHEADRVGLLDAGRAERAAAVDRAFVLPLEGLAVLAAAVADVQRGALRHDVQHEPVRETDGEAFVVAVGPDGAQAHALLDRKSTRLNSSH